LKKISFFIATILLNSSILFSQVAINTDGSTPGSSSMLDVKSTTKGVLIPRMTFVQRNALPGPVDGLIVFCTNCSADGTGALSIYQGGLWKILNLNCSVPNAPAAGSHVPSLTQIIWKWTTVPIDLGYKWNTVNNYNTATDLGTALSLTETGLTCWTNYTRYVWAYNACGPSPVRILSQTTSQLPFSPAPTAGTHIASPVQIIWNWNSVSGATGYKWNTTNSIETATDMGTFTTTTETGLACGTSYTRYVWAYNGCGSSTPLTIVQSTVNCWACGSPFTVNHVAGTFAPVDKTTTYGTVTNIPGETNHCWITSNLGSDNQATAVNDATEASAGWYWQFDLPQGYKHDGTTRTPDIIWLTSVSELSNWIAENDPCTHELGAGWRIPTSAEWTNVDAADSWSSWNGPWNSLLKMHAAGRLYQSTGVRERIGVDGAYWSSNQSAGPLGMGLYFYSSSSGIALNNKAMGFSIRCLKD
jgi:hypothetical protein